MREWETQRPRANDPRPRRPGREVDHPTRLDRLTDSLTHTYKPTRRHLPSPMGGLAARSCWAAQVRRWLCVGCVGGRDGSRPSRPPHGHAGRFSGGQSSRRGRQASSVTTKDSAKSLFGDGNAKMVVVMKARFWTPADRRIPSTSFVTPENYM